ncbi:putative phenylalanyl-tRNA synthetase mitochondrial [Schistosoma mansoni]|uniref:putative phenylalanyl-tRNA synthetase mitochondrial n=1 Tax=Schistosoma mansoni TaxID=6183 RepID=UPI0001A63F1F|nr:putative phenylalanyl-tRNA synthetase mitochondrial [Schistosoma mansoni]|eukprot:XP_018653315.1 putative phenylalanyl-tRNA synthetase mitochondrial [Schistosoma mansoni]
MTERLMRLNLCPCYFRLFRSSCIQPHRLLNTKQSLQLVTENPTSSWVSISGQSTVKDSWYNLTPHIIELTKRSLHNQQHHPLNLIKQRIVDFMFKRHVRHVYNNNQSGTPLFSLYDHLSPVVTVRKNFDSLFIPPDHPSRSRTDTYYLNETTVLRSHTSAHQLDLISSGLNAFLVAGDVYRRDDIDSLHYPVFHQLEGVRLFTSDEVRLFPQCLYFVRSHESNSHPFRVFPSYMLPPDKQVCHTTETKMLLEFELKTVLKEMAKSLFGPDIQLRWVNAYFPFTHPSWELEIKTKSGYSNYDGDSDSEKPEEWTEILGCGIMRQELLERSGIPNKVGYAFGLGLERWAMRLYEIPDIRLFWSKDQGFLNQFITDDIHAPIKYKPVSIFPPCILDLSFWLNDSESISSLSFNPDGLDRIKIVERDIFDLVRSEAGDLIEQIRLVDSYIDPKTGRQSLCYRFIYRDQHKTLTMDTVRPLHENIGQVLAEKLNLSIR